MFIERKRGARMKNVKVIRDTARERYVGIVDALLRESGEDVMHVKSNELAFPIESKGEEMFVVVTVKIPTGSRDGDMYDGYEEARDFQRKLVEKKEKDELKKVAKAKKIAADKKRREKLKEMKKEREERE